MALHAPAHPGGVAWLQAHHLFYLLGPALAVLLAVGLVAIGPSLTSTAPQQATSELESLAQYRAGERAMWSTSEADSMARFRAGERASWEVSERDGLAQFRAGEREAWQGK